ncbi:hypothetical protein [Marinobacter gelidimuriae]|uniref:hypothetical protein n=1 Tax=Marinobacter gelidimuriae TaxID=2739064 RepID=UPI0003A94E75|nr:hypothetical protein [Marinobacter gelidimuriae]
MLIAHGVPLGSHSVLYSVLCIPRNNSLRLLKHHVTPVFPKRPNLPENPLYMTKLVTNGEVLSSNFGERIVIKDGFQRAIDQQTSLKIIAHITRLDSDTKPVAIA